MTTSFQYDDIMTGLFRAIGIAYPKIPDEYDKGAGTQPDGTITLRAEPTSDFNRAYWLMKALDVRTGREKLLDDTVTDEFARSTDIKFILPNDDISPFVAALKTQFPHSDITEADFIKVKETDSKDIQYKVNLGLLVDGPGTRAMQVQEKGVA